MLQTPICRKNINFAQTRYIYKRNKPMKKILKTSILTALLLFSLLLASCGSSDGQGQTDEVHVHKVIHWQTVKEADCESTGRRFGTCIDCKNEVREETAALGHIYGSFGCVRCEDGHPSRGFEFTLNEAKNAYTVTGISDERMKEAVIPAEYLGLPVTAVGNGAFSGSSLKSVILPETVKVIRRSAFAGCTKLESVKLGDGLTEICANAFMGCESLEEIIMPKSVSILGEGAFRSCGALKKAVLSDSIMYINEYAFASCEKLESVNIPKSCDVIGAHAFNGCGRLSETELSENLIIIGDYAFAESGIEAVNFPKRLQSIGEGAFQGSDLRSVTLYSSSLGSYAFADCPDLETVYNGNLYPTSSDRQTGIGIFSGCKNLKSAEIGGGIIAHGFFSGCSSLEYVKISKDVAAIRIDAFLGCSSVSVIDYEGTQSRWEKIEKSDGWDGDMGEYEVNFR